MSKPAGRVISKLSNLALDEFGNYLIGTSSIDLPLIPDNAAEIVKGIKLATKGLSGLPGIPGLPELPDVAKQFSGKIENVKDKLQESITNTLGNLTADASITSDLKGKMENVVGELRGVVPKIPSLPNLNLQDELGSLLSFDVGSTKFISSFANIKDKFGDTLSGKGIDLDGIINNLKDAANPLVLSQLGELDTIVDSMKLKIKTLGNLGAIIDPELVEVLQLPELFDEEDIELYGSGSRKEFIYDMPDLVEKNLPSVSKESLKGLKSQLSAQLGQIESVKNLLSDQIGSAGTDLPDMISKIVPNLEMPALGGDVIEKAKKAIQSAVDSVQEEPAELNLNPEIVRLSSKLRNNLTSFPIGNGNDKGKIIWNDTLKKSELVLPDIKKNIPVLENLVDKPTDIKGLMGNLVKELENADLGLGVLSGKLAGEGDLSDLFKQAENSLSEIPVELFELDKKSPLNVPAVDDFAKITKTLDDLSKKINPTLDQGLSDISSSQTTFSSDAGDFTGSQVTTFSSDAGGY